MALLIALVCFALIGGLGLAFVGGGDAGSARAAKRAKAFAGGIKRNAKRIDGVEQANIKRKQANAEALKELSERQKRSRKFRFSIKGRIAQSGLAFSPAVFWIASGLLGAAAALIALILGAPLWMTGLAALAAFLGVPRWALGMLISTRQKKFASQLADGLDIIVRGVKSGLPLAQCMRIIASESPEPLRGEFKTIVDAQSMGSPLDQNLQKLYERMPLPEVNFFVIVLIIQQKTGGNLSEALGNLSTVLRSRKMLKEKIKALSSEAKASAMIIGALPFIVMILVYFTKRDYILTLFTHPTGHLILMGAATMYGMGIMVMRNMINFKF